MLKKEKYWGFWNSSLLQNIKKMETKKFEKRRTVPKKKQSGDPTFSSVFVSYV